MKPSHQLAIQIKLKWQAFWELFKEKLHGKHYDLKGCLKLSKMTGYIYKFDENKMSLMVENIQLLQN